MEATITALETVLPTLSSAVSTDLQKKLEKKGIASLNCYGEALVKKRAFPRVASNRSKTASQVIKKGQTTFANWAECFKRQWNETAY